MVPASADTRQGLFDVHQVEGKLLFEIPDSVLGRDMLIMSRYDETQDGFSQVGASRIHLEDALVRNGRALE